MPGEASLHANQYYGHPQNLFWKLLGEILGFDPALPYEARIAHVQTAGIAIWDVLQSCSRPGSLDSAIDPQSIVVNDFTSFFAAHPAIQRICFNGSTAEALFARYVRPTLPAGLALDCFRLPSTSPANASITRDAKLIAWRAALHIDRNSSPASPAR